MKTQKQYQVKARKPRDRKFGDFVITDVKFDSQTAIADFGNGAKAEIDVSNIMPSICGYSRSNKKYYVRAV